FLPALSDYLYIRALHVALPICEVLAAGLPQRQRADRGEQAERGHRRGDQDRCVVPGRRGDLGEDHGGEPGAEAGELVAERGPGRSEEHTSELQSREKLVCRLLL